MDLEVYQKALELAVFVAKLPSPLPELPDVGKKEIKVKRGRGERLTKEQATSAAGRLIFHNMLPCALGIPHLIAEAHSLRFGDHSNSIVALERVMLNCNKTMVYLEQVRDICQTGLPWEDFDEQIKKYIYLRHKVLNLQRSWKKFDSQKIAERSL